MIYGICLVCKSPREARKIDNTFEIVCPNGHDQDENVWAEFDKTPLIPDK